MGYILLPVYRDNEKIDTITGLIANSHKGHPHSRGHQKSGIKLIGEAVSDHTGEVFRFRMVNIQDKVNEPGTFHIDLIGSLGTRYVGTFTCDNSGDLTYVRVSVPDQKEI